jgi:hypothetical protein
MKDMQNQNRLFSYGTLQQSGVQESLFGRRLETVEDTLPGFAKEFLTITDPAVIAKSGSDSHPILKRTGNPLDVVEGCVLSLSDAELAAADDYEVDDYVRTEVELGSGTRSWVYLAAPVPGATVSGDGDHRPHVR